MADALPIAVTVNGTRHEHVVEPRLLLSDFLRHHLGLTGTHVGCEHGVCGACTVHLDGVPVRSCLIFAVQAHGCEVSTVEGLAERPSGEAPEDDWEAAAEAATTDPDAVHLHPLQAAFREAHALQCGFCTPGVLMTLVPFLDETPDPTEDQIREVLGGHLCRCTGYQNMVTAVRRAARPGQDPAEPRLRPGVGGSAPDAADPGHPEARP